VTLAVKLWSLTALSFLVFRPILAGRRNGKARNGEPKIMRSYSAAVLAALGGAFVVTEPGLKAAGLKVAGSVRTPGSPVSSP
jgi:hypothetical protein